MSGQVSKEEEARMTQGVPAWGGQGMTQGVPAWGGQGMTQVLREKDSQEAGLT